MDLGCFAEGIQPTMWQLLQVASVYQAFPSCLPFHQAADLKGAVVPQLIYRRSSMPVPAYSVLFSVLSHRG